MWRIASLEWNDAQPVSINVHNADLRREQFVTVSMNILARYILSLRKNLTWGYELLPLNIQGQASDSPFFTGMENEEAALYFKITVVSCS